jgi:asparagine synthase (glutamine-hydrolysing)
MSNAAYYCAGTQEEDSRKLLSRDFLTQVHASITEDVNGLEDDLRHFSDPLAPYSRFDIRWYLPDDILTKVDRMSMAHALEVRGPFLDYRVMEFAARLPANWKISGSINKSILRDAYASALPAVVLEPRKRGFSPPLGNWLRAELRPYIEDLYTDPIVQSGMLNANEIRGIVREHMSGARDRSSQLWRILIFARWWRLHLNRCSAQAPASVATAQ